MDISRLREGSREENFSEKRDWGFFERVFQMFVNS